MQGSTVMRQSSAEALVTEEPYALIAHVRVCGGAGWVTTGSTRNHWTSDVKAAHTVMSYYPMTFGRHQIVLVVKK
jgi:hypothetical protein